MQKKNNIVYPPLIFKKQDRPFFYTSFVSTIDGKIFVNKNGYWPIGSKTDYDTFTFLRAHCDAILDGKNTALTFGKNTIETIHRKDFLDYRKELNKDNDIKYFVVSSHPDNSLAGVLNNLYGFKVGVITNNSSKVENSIINSAEIYRVNDTNNINEIVQLFATHNINNVFIDGGPRLIGSFLKYNLIDEIFLTIAPKIFGDDNSALTMIEGVLFEPKDIKEFNLLSSKKINDEVYLRYRRKY